MKDSTKSLQRIEKKKKKMAALLEISRLNQHDRNKATQVEQTEAQPEAVKASLEPSPKRLRTEEGEVRVVLERSCKHVANVFQAFVASPKEDLADQNSVGLGPSGKPLLHGDDFLELKRALKEHTKKMRVQPKLRLREIGENASITVSIDDRVPLFVSDIQHLLMVSQIGCHSPYSPARWCQPDKFYRLECTVALVVDNVSLVQYQTYQHCFPFISSMFPHKLEIVTPFAYKGKGC